MGWYSREEAFEVTGLDPDEYDSLAAIAVGKLDEEHEEGAPNSRKPLSDIIHNM
jgi:nitroreductase